MRSTRILLSVVRTVLPAARRRELLHTTPASATATVRRRPTRADAPAGTKPGWLIRLTITRQLGAGGVRMQVRVAGDIDAATAPVLAEALALVWHDTRNTRTSTEIVVDLRHVEFLSAAGIHVLVHAQERCRADGMGLRVVAGHPAVTRPLELTGLSHVLGLRPDPYAQEHEPPTGTVTRSSVRKERSWGP